MNCLFFSDLHINKDELVECESVLNEILSLCNQYKVDQLFDLGDTFDSLKLNSNCLDLFSSFIKKWNKPITILAAQSHESETVENSLVNHYGILDEKVKIVKEYKDGNSLYLGHFIAKESKKNYGGIISLKVLESYRKVLLGHGHSFERVAGNLVQLGSCRWIDFGESGDTHKVIALCENYGQPNEKWNFLGLKSPIPMIDIELSTKSIKNIKNETITSTVNTQSTIFQAQSKAKQPLSQGE